MPELVAYSDVGEQRSTNEDTVLTETLGDAHLLLVADGMVGDAAGDVASQCATTEFLEVYPVIKMIRKMTRICLSLEYALHTRKSKERPQTTPGVRTWEQPLSQHLYRMLKQQPSMSATVEPMI